MKPSFVRRPAVRSIRLGLRRPGRTIPDKAGHRAFPVAIAAGASGAD
jgi:hypothetical protein